MHCKSATMLHAVQHRYSKWVQQYMNGRWVKPGWERESVWVGDQWLQPGDWELRDYMTELCFNYKLEWARVCRLDFEYALSFSGCCSGGIFWLLLYRWVLNVRKHLQIYTCTDRAGERLLMPFALSITIQGASFIRALYLNCQPFSYTLLVATG